MNQYSQRHYAEPGGYFCLYAMSLIVAHSAAIGVCHAVLGMHGPTANPYGRLAMVGASCLGLIFILAQRSIVVNRRFFTGVMIHVAFITLGTFNGIMFDGPPVYLVANTLYLTFQLLNFLVFCDPRFESSETSSAVKFFDTGLIICALSVVPRQVAGYIQGGPVGLSPEIAPLIFCGLIWAVIRNRWLPLMCCLLAISLGLPNLSRGIAAEFLVVAPFALFGMRAMPVKVASIIAIFGVLITVIVVGFQSGAFDKTQLARRIKDSLNEADGERTLSLDQRFYELKTIEDTWRRDPYRDIRLFVGFGTGSTIDQSGSEDLTVRDTQVSDSTTTHNIHFLIGALFYRYGLFGLLWWGFLLMVVFYGLAEASYLLPRRRYQPETLLYLVCMCICAMTMLGSFIAAGQLLSNPIIGAFFSMGIVNRAASREASRVEYSYYADQPIYAER